MNVAIAHPGLVARYRAHQAPEAFNRIRKTGSPGDEGPLRQRGKTPADQKGFNDGQDRVSFSREAEMIRKLQIRDREVKVHERMHASVGGRHTGHPTLTMQKGPDGRSYAVEGEVSIDTSAIPGDPEETLEKAETIRRAALAPMQPSIADRKIAAKATKLAITSKQELSREAQDNGERNFSERAQRTGTLLSTRA